MRLRTRPIGKPPGGVEGVQSKYRLLPLCEERVTRPTL